MHRLLVVSTLCLLTVVCVTHASSSGLSLDTRYLLATSFQPRGNIANLLPTASGNGWTVETWLTWQPSVLLPARTRTLFEQHTLGCCTTSPSNNFRYGVHVLASGVVRVSVYWHNGTLTVDSSTALVTGEAHWTHLAVVFKRTEGIYLYVNGQLDNASLLQLLPNDVNLLSFVWNSASPFRNNGTLVLFDDTGLMDEIRFRPIALSAGAVRSVHCKRVNGNSNGVTARWSFDSNLAADGVTRQYTNVTFDMHTTGSQPNNLEHALELPDAALPQVEPHFCAADTMPTAVTVTLALVFSVCVILIAIWLIVVLALHYANKNAVATAAVAGNRASSVRPLGGTDSSIDGGGSGGGVTAVAATHRRKARKD